MATDEAWQVLIDASPSAQSDAQRAPMVTSPAEGEHVTSRPTIAFTSPLSASSRWRPSNRGRTWTSLLSWLIRPAFAHQPPISGPIYLISVTNQNLRCPIYAITTERDWKLTEEAYRELRAVAGQPLAVRVVGAYLRDNRITEGPFVAPQARTIYVHP